MSPSSPSSSTSSPQDRTAYPCPWCGDWPSDEDRLGNQPYCRSCHAERLAVYRARRRRARLSKWYREVATADAEKAAGLTAELVKELGGYRRAARQLAEWIRAINAEGKAPGQAMRANVAILRLMQLSLPPDE